MEEEIFKISKNSVRAKSLKEMALERLNDVKGEEKPYKIVEQYYEVLKELIISLMYLDGCKTLSHKALIPYLEINYSTIFDKEEIILMDDLRKLRNNIGYYGKKIDKSYLINKGAKIKKIINKLISILDKKL